MFNKSVFIVVTLLTIFSSLAIAAEPNRAVTIEKDIAYVPNGDKMQVLDLYIPTKPSETPLPLIVWIHGGGWISDKGRMSRLRRHAFVRLRGCERGVPPQHRREVSRTDSGLSGGHPLALGANSKKYNIDPDRIGVWGASAGGHLSALLGTAGGSKAFPPIGGNENVSDRVQAVCDMYGPADFRTVVAQAAAESTRSTIRFNTSGDPYTSLIGAKLGEDERSDAVSPVHFVDKKSPPFLILHGTADATVPFAQSVELADALKKAGVDVTFQKFPGVGHGGLAFREPAARALISRFFDKNLKGADVKVEVLPDSELVPKTPAK